VSGDRRNNFKIYIHLLHSLVIARRSFLHISLILKATCRFSTVQRAVLETVTHGYKKNWEMAVSKREIVNHERKERNDGCFVTDACR